MKKKQDTDQITDGTAEGRERMELGRAAYSLRGFASRFIKRLKPFYGDYGYTVWLLFWYSIVAYFALVNWMNPAPAYEKLRWISGEIISAQIDHPHLKVRLPDGSVKKLDFYGDLSYAPRGFPRALYGKVVLDKLHGCQAELGIYQVKWLILPYNERVWEVRCKEFRLSYAETIKEYNRSVKISRWVAIFPHSIFIFIISVVFNAERKRKRKWDKG